MKTTIPFNISNIFQSHCQENFERLCLEIFNYQYKNIEAYGMFVDALHIQTTNVQCIEDIPFMPIEFFKNHQILKANTSYDAVFKSSGTTGMERSRHYVQSLQVYQESFTKAFQHFYGSIENYTVLALLPSYMENGNSSLVFMADQLIKDSKNKDSGFYLNDYRKIVHKLHELRKQNKKVILLGVSYALLDLVEMEHFHMPQMIVMETGGMKGRRKEMLREELHEILKASFGVKHIHSEYGMTELLSQAYSQGNGVFSCPPWMRVLIRDVNDPLSYMSKGKSGAINIIDLANVFSVSFLATKDLGKIINRNQFSILGRFDNSDIRGCNLLIA
jgi:phenylacetate-coenzyme A ligase PaaK-like adenylate-forming protein